MGRVARFASAALAAAPLAAQAPELASLVRPLPIPWELCKTRAADALRAEGYQGLLESGNGWIARARGTAVSVSCIGRNRESVLVLVTAGGQLVREATLLWERIRVDTLRANDQAPPPPLSSAAVPERSGWSASAAALAGRPGVRFNFWCPPNGTPHPVWGDSAYRAESSVCTAAVHAGTITLAAGGNAIVELRPGRESYQGATRGGITSLPFGHAPASFVIITP